MNRFCEVGALNSGGPESESAEVVRRPKAIGDQFQEDANRTFRELDPPIVVRDGNAGHKAKGRAGSNASTGITTGHEYPRSRCQTPCLQWEWVLAPCVSAGSVCAFPEEPGAVIPHAGIREGGTGQPVYLPRSAKN
jgi:hypothetical protein